MAIRAGRVTTDVNDLVDCDLVVEAIVEDPDAKRSTSPSWDGRRGRRPRDHDIVAERLRAGGRQRAP